MFACTIMGRTVQWNMLIAMPLPLTGFTTHRNFLSTAAVTSAPSHSKELPWLSRWTAFAQLVQWFRLALWSPYANANVRCFAARAPAAASPLCNKTRSVSTSASSHVTCRTKTCSAESAPGEASRLGTVVDVHVQVAVALGRALFGAGANNVLHRQARPSSCANKSTADSKKSVSARSSFHHQEF